MGQIHGSGAGNWSNAAVVDSSLGTQQGRLYVNAAIASSTGSPILSISPDGGLSTSSVYPGTSAMKFKNQLDEIIIQLKQINTQLSFVTDEQLNKGG